jgi:hypothetical protein
MLKTTADERIAMPLLNLETLLVTAAYLAVEQRKQ